MSLLRAFGRLFLMVALVSAAIDGARAIATPSDGLAFTSLDGYFAAYAPQARGAIQSFFLANAPVSVWTGFVAPLLELPVSLLSATLGVILFLAGYRPPPPEIVSEN